MNINRIIDAIPFLAGLSPFYQDVVRVTISITATVLLLLLVRVLARVVIERGLGSMVRRSRNKLDDALLHSSLLRRLARLVPSVVLYALLPILISSPDWLAIGLRRLLIAYMIINVAMIAFGAIEAFHTIYRQTDYAIRRPIKSYLQVAKIIVLVFAAVMGITALFGQSSLSVLGGLGALSAVLLLIFKDPILGLVAGIQLTANNLIQIGDWITIDKYDADGEVLDMSLQTVRVQNWNKTIVSIPIYSLISESFSNWRGMSESGGRRIKRALYVDSQSVRFCTPEMQQRFKQFALVQEHIKQRQAEIETHNRNLGITDNDAPSGRRMTNLGLFRTYIFAYLQRHPGINTNLTCMVRQRQATDSGIPIEVYAFANDQRWEYYEGIQADIFDHLFAVISQFDLRLFQRPSGIDIRQALIGTSSGSLEQS